MTIDLLREFEAIPEAYPTVTPSWTVEMVADDPNPNEAQIWQRIESYVSHRWTPREVVWTLFGNGGDEFTPRLTPMVSHVARFWGDQWEGLTLDNGPLGLILPFCGTYQITAQVGAGDVPAAVSEAFKRLHEYTRGISDSFKNEAAMRTDSDTEMVTNWTGRALQLSGAADLLRPYRRQK